MDQGQIWLADLREDERRRVVVMSAEPFHRLADRVWVVPELVGGEHDDLPWRLVIDDRVYAVDHLRSVPVSSLLERVGTVPAPELARARRALLAITA